MKTALVGTRGSVNVGEALSTLKSLARKICTAGGILRAGYQRD